MIKNLKKIAILLATYQGERYIREQLNSLLKQTNKDWTVFMHDDGSKDGTETILKAYCEKYPDKFILLEGVPTGGAKTNFLFLTLNVESEFYMYCDQDDIWLNDKVQKTYDQMLKIIEEGKPCLVHTDLAVVDAQLNVHSESMSRYQKLNCNDHNLNKALIQNTVTGCTMMINRTLRDMLILPCDWTKVIMHDWWAAIIASAFGNVSYLPIHTILYRQHGDNSVGAKKIGLISSIMSSINKREEIVKSLEKTRIQAQEFNCVFSDQCPELSKIYAEIGKYGKCKRLFTYCKYHFYKSSVIRNVGLIFFG